MFYKRFCVFSALVFVLFAKCLCQEYDFAAEMTRQCLVPDPVGLLDCVENRVTLPYMTSWVECTNSLGQNVRTSEDIINYRCKSVWEGKGLIPEVFYIKDCVIEKTGLPAKNVSAEVLGAYKECEKTPTPQQQGVKIAAPVQQQQFRVSSVEYGSPVQQFQAPVAKPPSQSVQVQTPIQQFTAPVLSQPQNIAPRQQFQVPASRPIQPQISAPAQRPIQQLVQVAAPRSVVQQFPSAPILQTPARYQLTQQQGPAALNQAAVPRTQYQTPTTGFQQPYMAPNAVNSARQPYSQQFFVIFPQVPSSNQYQNINKPILSQKTAANPTFIPQQQIMAPTQQVGYNPNIPFSYSFQIRHPLKPGF